MKICHFCSSHVDAPYFLNLGKGLTERGISQHFVTLNQPNPPSWIEAFPSIHYKSLDIRSRAHYPKAVWRLSKFLRENEIEILQTHLFDSAVLGTISKYFVKTPYRIVTRHHLDDAALLGSRFHVMLDKWTNMRANVVIVPSKATEIYMREVEEQEESEIRVVPYGFDFSKLTASDSAVRAVRSEFAAEEDFIIGCVGRFHKNKGHRYLFEAIKGLIRKFPNIKVVLLGSGDRSMLEEEIRRLEVSNHVTFAGYRNDIPAAMMAMDLLVHPSLSESFGQVIVEAMAVGTAVVATSVGGISELIDDELTGLLVPPGDSKALAISIERMIKSANLREKLSVRGKASVTKKFGVDLFVDRMYDLYQEMITK